MMIDALNRLNTTSFRIVMTVGLTYATGFRYMLSGVKVGTLEYTSWTPSWEWLLFLSACMSVEGAILIAKRMTDYKYKEIAVSAKPNVTVEQAQDVNVKAQEVTVVDKPVTTPTTRAKDGAVG